MGIKIIKPVIRNECAGFFVGMMLRQHSCLWAGTKHEDVFKFFAKLHYALCAMLCSSFYPLREVTYAVQKSNHGFGAGIALCDLGLGTAK